MKTARKYHWANGAPERIDIVRDEDQLPREAALAGTILGMVEQEHLLRKKLDEETKTVDAGQAEWEKTVDRATLPKELADLLAQGMRPLTVMSPLAPGLIA